MLSKQNCTSGPDVTHYFCAFPHQKQEQTHEHTHTHTLISTHKVQCLFPSSSSHKPGIRDLLVRGTLCMYITLFPLHNWETGAFESKADSLKNSNTDTHLEIPSYYRVRYNYVLPPP